MIDFGAYTVWTISIIVDPEDWVRVTLKCPGRADALVDCPISQAPIIGSEVTLGWR